MTVRPSVCPLDCPDRCSLSVTVDGDRVVSLDGSRSNPATGGYICGKVRGFGDRAHGPLRVLRPKIRVGPKGPGATFRDVSWDEAMGLVAERFRAVIAADGPEALLPYWYAGSNGWLTGGALDQRLWSALGATRILRTFCAANASAAVRASYGDLPSADPMDVDHADLVVLWGVNPSASGIHLVPRVRALQARGGTSIVVDPRRTPLAKAADLHLQPLPGTDVALALAVARHLFETGRADQGFLARHVADADAFRGAADPWTLSAAAAATGVPEASIRALAERYADAPTPLLRVGWGLERTRNGTDAIRAVLALPAVAGKFGRRGAGYCLSTSGGYRVDKTRWQQVAHAPPARTVNMSELGRVLQTLTDPPIRALYVYDCNPVATAPDQARVRAQLARDDLFTVVHEQVHTDTCDYADVVLPATTFLEHHELAYSYGGYLLQWSEPVIPPVGEARSNHAVMRDLADRLGLDDPALQVTELELAEQIAGHARADWPTLRRDRVVHLPKPVQFGDVFPSAPVTLVGPLGPPTLRPPPADADRPLILVSPSSTRGISSTMYETQPPGTAALVLHPDDAAARGISTGDRVRVDNDQGAIEVLAEVSDAVRPGVVSLPKGLWLSATLGGGTSNALIPPHVDVHGGGACYNDARVDVTRA